MSRVESSLVAAAVALALVSCRDSPTVHRVGKVLVDSALGGDGVSLDKELVRQALRAELRRSKHLREDPEGGARLRARAVAGRVPPDPSGAPVVLVALSFVGAGAMPRTEELQARAEQRGVSPSDHPDPLLEAAVRSAFESLGRQIALGDQPTARVIDALQDEDRDLRAHAISLLAARRDPQAFDALVRMLEDEDQVIALRAVGAVVALGDARGVKVLTDLTHRKPASFVRQIVYAVGAIGGAEAEAYLFTVATGHPDAAVKQAAEEALGELQRRAGTARPVQEGS